VEEVETNRRGRVGKKTHKGEQYGTKNEKTQDNLGAKVLGVGELVESCESHYQQAGHQQRKRKSEERK